MNCQDREESKKPAWTLIGDGKTPEERMEGYLMLMESHFHHNLDAPDFPTYAEHWLAASAGDIDEATLNLLQSRFPAPTKRMIADGYSTWGSYGDPACK